MSGEFCGSYGINTKCGFAPSGAIDAAAAEVPTNRVEILAENFTFSDQIIGGRGITGSLDDITNHLREGARMVRGGIVTEIGPNELAPWISAICANSSADETKDTFDSVPHDFTLLRDLVGHSYRYCVLEEARLRCRSDQQNPENQSAMLSLSFLGVEEKTATFPGGLALPSDNRYYWIMGDSKFTYGGSDFPMDEFDLRVRYNVKPIFRNLLLPGCFRCLGREITLNVKVPFSPTSATALYGANDTDKAAAISMVSTNLPASASDYSTIFTFANTRRIAKNANTSSEDEIPLDVTLKAYQKGASPAMAVTNVVTAP